MLRQSSMLTRFANTFWGDVYQIMQPDLMLVPKGDKFTQFPSFEGAYGTNTAEGAPDTWGNPTIAFNGTDAYVDITSIIRGTLPVNGMIFMILKHTDWQSDNLEQYLRLENSTVTDRIHARKAPTNKNVFIHEGDNTAVTTQASDYDTTGYTGFHQLGYAWASTPFLYEDGAEIIEGASLTAITGAATQTAYIGTDIPAGTYFVGDMSLFAVRYDAVDHAKVFKNLAQVGV